MGKGAKFLLGAALGAAAAALLTPVAGKAARASLKKAASQGNLNKLAERGSAVVNSVIANIAPQPRRKTKAKK